MDLHLIIDPRMKVFLAADYGMLTTESLVWQLHIVWRQSSARSQGERSAHVKVLFKTYTYRCLQCEAQCLNQCLFLNFLICVLNCVLYKGGWSPPLFSGVQAPSECYLLSIHAVDGCKRKSPSSEILAPDAAVVAVVFWRGEVEAFGSYAL